ncbi:MAG: beta-ketoacyl-ACP synthase III [Alphaproteobacteria bacterium]
MKRAVISGMGSCLPEKVLTNFDLEKMVETSDAWIRERTGIVSRHIAGKDETTADLALRAATEALSCAGVQGADVEMIVVATTTPDDTFPATATKIQASLGAKGFAFDVQAACSGFMYALSVADHFIKAGTVRNALVIGAETLSRIVNWTDRNTCVLFGDGAGAAYLTAEEGTGTMTDSGVLNIILHSDGHLRDMLKSSGGVSATKTVGTILMEGREVFRHAVTNLAEVAGEVMAVAGIKESDIDYLVPHQANIRIIEGTAKKLNMPMDRVIVTLPEHGNTSSASIPLALYEGIKSGRLKKGDLLLLESMGAGLTWAGGLIRL